MNNSLDALNWKQVLKSYMYLHYCTEQFNNHSKKTNIPTKKKNEPLFSWGWGYHAYMITIIRRKQIHNKEAWAIVLMMIPYNIYDIDCLKSWLKITFLVILSNVCNKHYPLLFIAHILTQIFDFGIKPRMCVSRWC